MLSCVGGRYRVLADGEVCEASVRGRLKRRGRDRVLVGDLVDLAHHPDGSITIEGVHGRRSLLRRRSPGSRRGVRTLAANVEQVVVVGAAARPTWDSRMMDRFTAVAEANGLPVLVVVNKCDLVEDCGELAAPYRAAGYPVLVTSVPLRRGLEALRARLAGRISLLTGPTGVGKSSLLNALHPGLRLRTGDVGERRGVGRHTTVAAEMHPFGDDGFVVDTPGLRDIGLWGLAADEVAAAFPELGAYAGTCRFDDCRHLEEPGCAVVGAAERGDLTQSRLASYRQLLDEALRAGRPGA